MSDSERFEVNHCLRTRDSPLSERYYTAPFSDLFSDILNKFADGGENAPPTS